VNPVRLLISTLAAVLFLRGGARAQKAYVANEGSRSVSMLDASGMSAAAGAGSGLFGMVSEL